MQKTVPMKAGSIDEYLSHLPDLQRERLEYIRNSVKQIVPEAAEVISYGMPAFRCSGMLLYMAAHKNHIGIYPGSTTAIIHFGDKLKDFTTSKGTIQIRNDQILPKALIKKIIRFRIKENLRKGKSKRHEASAA